MSCEGDVCHHDQGVFSVISCISRRISLQFISLTTVEATGLDLYIQSTVQTQCLDPCLFTRLFSYRQQHVKVSESAVV